MTTPIATTPEPATPAALTPHDECDVCTIAQARVLVVSPEGKHLTLCKHHYEKHADTLGFQGFIVAHDIREVSA